MFTTGQNLLKKIIEERQILTQSIVKSFLIDRLTTNNAIYRDSLKVTSATKTVTSQNVSLSHRSKNFLFRRKFMFRSQDIQVFVSHDLQNL